MDARRTPKPATVEQAGLSKRKFSNDLNDNGVSSSHLSTPPFPVVLWNVEIYWSVPRGSAQRVQRGANRQLDQLFRMTGAFSRRINAELKSNF